MILSFPLLPLPTIVTAPMHFYLSQHPYYHSALVGIRRFPFSSDWNRYSGTRYVIWCFWLGRTISVYLDFTSWQCLKIAVVPLCCSHYCLTVYGPSPIHSHPPGKQAFPKCLMPMTSSASLSQMHRVSWPILSPSTSTSTRHSLSLSSCQPLHFCAHLYRGFECT